MKKLSKLLSLALVFVMLLGLKVNVQAAEHEGVRVYLYNTLNWEKVCVYSWTEGSNAPELTEMTQGKSEGWYYFDFAPEMGETIDFLFYDGEWGAGHQTGDIQITDGQDAYYYTKEDLVDGSNNNQVNEVVYAASKAEVDKVFNEKADELKTTIYFRITTAERKSEELQGWGDDAYIWAWTAKGNLYDEWPGEKMKAIKGTDGWYKITVKATEDFQMVFNSGAKATIQTADSDSVTPGGVYWAVVNGYKKVDGNDGLGGGALVKVTDKAQPGWPEAELSKQDENETGATKVAEKQATKKSNKGWYFLFIVGIVVVLIIGILVNKNHKKNNRVA